MSNTHTSLCVSFARRGNPVFTKAMKRPSGDQSVGIWKSAAGSASSASSFASFPTAWNNLEAGILFGLGLPILIFKEDGISGGVFDNGVTDVFIHKMPVAKPSAKDDE